ncbi:MAG: hypothetical protein H7346_10545 [Burkholderiaceae bacterium]|nr:hypothetical protein [Burkholderiaceae bacterium]
MDRKQLERHYEIASGDYRRLAYLLAEVRRKEPDHLVALAMMSPVVEAARKTLELAASALREARGDRHKIAQ